MYDTFKDCYTAVLQHVGLSTTAPTYVNLAQLRINESYLKILNLFEWNFLRNEKRFLTQPFVQNGAVTGVQGAQSVTGSGISWSAVTPPGWYFIGPDYSIYDVESVTGGNQLNLDVGLSGSFAAETTYWLIQLLYQLPTNVNLPIEKNLYMAMEPRVRFIPEFEMRSKFRVPQFGPPRYWSVFFQATTQPWLVLYPFPDSQYVVSYAYNTIIQSLANDTDPIVIPEPFRSAVVDLAGAYLYLTVLNDINMGQTFAQSAAKTVKEMAIKYAPVRDQPQLRPQNYRRLRSMSDSGTILRQVWRY